MVSSGNSGFGTAALAAVSTGRTHNLGTPAGGYLLLFLHSYGYTGVS